MSKLPTVSLSGSVEEEGSLERKGGTLAKGTAKRPGSHSRVTRRVKVGDQEPLKRERWGNTQNVNHNLGQELVRK